MITPTHSSKILGNQPDISKLGIWLKTYDQELKKFKAKKLKKFNQAAMISGPVGIGHSLIVKLLAKEHKYRIITFDCSNCKGTRPKNRESNGSKMLDDMVYVSEIQVSKSPLLKKLILFETGDAINGTISREIINLIKKTHIPIIINCNDPYPLRTLSNYCFHIKLKRPTKVQIVNYLVSNKLIKSSEREKVLKEIETQGSDVRHILNSYEHGVKPAKDTGGQLNLFTATEKIFNEDSLKKKEEAFWEDYSMIPMMVQQNYIPSNASDSSKLNNLANASEALSDYALVDRYTGPGSWSMLPLSAYLVIRAVFLSKRRISSFPGPKFPESLGKGSSQRSNMEKLSDKSKNINMNISVIGYRLDFIPFIYRYFMTLVDSGTKEDLLKAILFLKKQGLTRDDLFDLIEKVTLEKITIESKKKSAFTRTYNKYFK